jgi:hypothetical protein
VETNPGRLHRCHRSNWSHNRRPSSPGSVRTQWRRRRPRSNPHLRPSLSLGRWNRCGSSSNGNPQRRRSLRRRSRRRHHRRRHSPPRSRRHRQCFSSPSRAAQTRPRRVSPRFGGVVGSRYLRSPQHRSHRTCCGSAALQQLPTLGHSAHSRVRRPPSPQPLLQLPLHLPSRMHRSSYRPPSGTPRWRRRPASLQRFRLRLRRSRRRLQQPQ